MSGIRIEDVRMDHAIGGIKQSLFTALFNNYILEYKPVSKYTIKLVLTLSSIFEISL